LCEITTKICFFAFKILKPDLELKVKNGSQILQIEQIFFNIINLLNLQNLQEPKNKKIRNDDAPD